MVVKEMQGKGGDLDEVVLITDSGHGRALAPTDAVDANHRH